MLGQFEILFIHLIQTSKKSFILL